ncbi:MAG: hypothetical protein LBT76_02065 [Tannerella sp.]|nr:hypothetical protein [Tannerella sp.]
MAVEFQIHVIIWKTDVQAVSPDSPGRMARSRFPDGRSAGSGARSSLPAERSVCRSVVSSRNCVRRREK